MRFNRAELSNGCCVGVLHAPVFALCALFTTCINQALCLKKGRFPSQMWRRAIKSECTVRGWTVRQHAGTMVRRWHKERRVPPIWGASDHQQSPQALYSSPQSSITAGPWGAGTNRWPAPAAAAGSARAAPCPAAPTCAAARRCTSCTAAEPTRALGWLQGRQPSVGF